MIKTIWKFPFDLAEVIKITAPEGARPLRVGLDPMGQACVWCEVNPDAPSSLLILFLVGTGSLIPSAAESYVGSYNDGSYVWHIYDAK